MSVLIVGDNGQEQAGDALALAEMLALLLEADITPVRVMGEGQQADQRAGVPESVAGERPATEIRVGSSPARILQELAESRHAAMVVLGSSHQAGMGRILPGGVGERLLQGGPCPIAVAPRGYTHQAPGEPRVIGVAFDDSSESHGALKLAARLGMAASAALRVICVYHGLPPQAEPTVSDSPTAHEQAQETLRRAVSALPGSLRAEPRFRTGHPVQVLVSETELGIDLLVMGSRGYGPVRSVLLGSVSDAVVRAVGCPVIVVPRDPGARGS